MLIKKLLLTLSFFSIVSPICSHLSMNAPLLSEPQKYVILAGGIFAAACATYYMWPDSEEIASQKAEKRAQNFREKIDNKDEDFTIEKLEKEGPVKSRAIFYYGFPWNKGQFEVRAESKNNRSFNVVLCHYKSNNLLARITHARECSNLAKWSKTTNKPYKSG